MKPSVVIIGAGQIGRALGQAASKNARVFYWDAKPAKATRHQPLSELLPTADIVLYCVPSWQLRRALLQCAPHISAQAVSVFISKGLEASAGRSTDEVARELLSPSGSVGFIGGPLLAGELRKGKTGIGVIASKLPQVRKRILALFEGTNIALETSSDLTGVIMSGVLKNIYTLGLGIIDGLGLGSNAKGWYVAQASAEAARLVVKFGGRPGTFLTTAGLGDFIATGFSPGSHGRRAGEELIRYGASRTECEGSHSLPVLKKKLGHGIDQYPLLLALTRSMTGSRRARQIFTKLFQSINDASVATS